MLDAPSDPTRRIVTVLEPSDEFPHTPDPVPNYNESMYLNGFDPVAEVGGWFRLGNRVNEGHAEMSVCVYLPNGRVGFMYGRPQITTNNALNAGGLTIDVVEPFKRLNVGYDGQVCLLDRPKEMADPRRAFADNPLVEAEVALEITGTSPMYGGLQQYDDGTPLEAEADRSFAKAHYEQHTAVRGTIRVGDETLALDGLGLRDKSWGPRYWQAISWYRWLPITFSPDFAMMFSVIDRDGEQMRAGMVLDGGDYHRILDCRVESDYDGDGYQTAMRCWARTDTAEYDVTGEVISLIPLRNRRTTDTGEQLHTRITEAMTRFECNGQRGIGMSEYLDQIVDGEPVGLKFA